MDFSFTFFFTHEKKPNNRGPSCKHSSFFEVLSNYLTDGFKLTRNYSYQTGPDPRICLGWFQNGIVIHVNTVGVLGLNARLWCV